MTSLVVELLNRQGDKQVFFLLSTAAYISTLRRVAHSPKPSDSPLFFYLAIEH